MRTLATEAFCCEYLSDGGVVSTLATEALCCEYLSDGGVVSTFGVVSTRLASTLVTEAL